MKFGKEVRRAGCARLPRPPIDPVRPIAHAQLMAHATTNPEWTKHYLDYKALKQILRQLAPTDAENQTEANAQVLIGLLRRMLARSVRLIVALRISPLLSSRDSSCHHYCCRSKSATPSSSAGPKSCERI